MARFSRLNRMVVVGIVCLLLVLVLCLVRPILNTSISSTKWLIGKAVDRNITIHQNATKNTTLQPRSLRTNVELIKHERDLYLQVPEHFDPDFKGPCWYDGKKRLTCLPHFYIAGFEKCGTTDLWHTILRHPDVVSVCKEPHWWVWRHYGYSATPICRQQIVKATQASGGSCSSIKCYFEFFRNQGVFSTIENKVTIRNKSSSFHPKVFGDASISTCYGTYGTFYSKYELENELYSATIPELLYSVTPNAKIIFILRNPVDRFRSQYDYITKNIGKSSRVFHDFTVKSLRCFNACLQQHSLYYCAHHVEICKGYLQVGIYGVFIRDWLKAFPRDQLHFLTLANMKEQPEKSIADIFQFLDLAPSPIQFKPNRVPVNAMGRNNKVAMLPETRRLLEDFYRPYNKEFLKLMDDEQFAWK